MRCDDVRPELVALERGECDAATAEAVRSHLAGCAACTAEARRLARAIEAVARATTLAPTPEGTARLLAAVDDALRAETVALEAVERRATFRVVRDLWEEARARYERSASFRRFTIASLAVHAAAAAFLAVTLARPAVTVPGEYRVTARVEPELAVDTGSAVLPVAFERATAEGVRAATGRVFPNAGTAQRLSALFDPAAREARLRGAVGDDAPAVAEALAALVRTLAGRQAPDGSFGDGGSFPGAGGATSATAQVVESLAAAGKDPRSDEVLARAAVWLDGRDASLFEDDATRASDLAAVVAARASLFVAEFDALDPGARTARRDGLARAAEALAKRQSPDGSFPADRGTGDRVGATLAATRALVAAREAGAADSSGTLAAAAAWLDASRTTDGRVAGRDRAATVTRTATLAALAPKVGLVAPSEDLRSRLAAQVAALAPRDPVVAAAGAEAFGPRATPVAAVVRARLGGVPEDVPVSALAADVRTLSRPLRD